MDARDRGPGQGLRSKLGTSCVREAGRTLETEARGRNPGQLLRSHKSKDSGKRSQTQHHNTLDTIQVRGTA